MIIITHYNECLDWLINSGLSGIIYSKGIVKPKIKNFKVIESDNFGGNQYDIIRFIYENYECLPDTMTFIQADPFDHCSKEIFWKKIKRKNFTPLESYSDLMQNPSCRKSKEIDCGYTEANNDWYIEAHNNNLWLNNHKITCPVKKFDNFMSAIFTDYQPLEWIRFTPGSQYTVEKWRCLNYSKQFWKNILNFIPKTNVNGGTEAHVLERALWLIFAGIYTERKNKKLDFKSGKSPMQYYLDSAKKNKIIYKIISMIKLKVFNKR